MVSEIALPSELAVILVAAALVGFLAKQTGQPTIVAYLVTGLVLGPAVLGVVAVSELTATMAELGLAFLLFLLGIKMRVEEVRHILGPIVKISIPQMVLVCLAGIGLALALGFTPVEAAIIGLAVMFSSTAVVIKLLTDREEVTATHGKIDVGVLLVQDIAVVILLAVLAAGQPESVGEVARTLGTVLVLIGLMAVAAVGASRWVLPAVFRRIADNKDVFFLVAISWGFLFVLLAQELALSIEIGAFLAGLAVAQLPYSKELQDRVNPLTDLFILVFFVSIGLQLEAGELLAYWPEAVLASLVLLPAKFLVFFALISWQDFDLETSILGSASMVQVSEFGLIVGSVAVASGFIDESVLGFLSLVALFTVSVSVYAITYNQHLVAHLGPLLDRWGGGDGYEGGDTTYRDHAVVIGYDDVTRNALPILSEVYDDVVVIDRQVEHIEQLEAAGFETRYGDFRHATIRKDAGLKDAAFVLSSSVEPAINTVVIEEADDDAIVFVEAEWAEDALKLYEAGADFVVLSTTLAADRLSEYLVAYLEDDASFEDAVGTDVALLRTLDSFPETHEHLRGGLDD